MKNGLQRWFKKRVGAIKEKVKKKHKNLNFMRGPNKI
jgi:hypothetical protein